MGRVAKSSNTRKSTQGGRRPPSRPKRQNPAAAKAAETAETAETGSWAPAGPNGAALEATLEALAASGRLEGIDGARVQAARSLAVAVDVNPASAALWAQYRAAEQALRDTGAPEVDEYAALLAVLRRDEAMGGKP